MDFLHLAILYFVVAGTGFMGMIIPQVIVLPAILGVVYLSFYIGGRAAK